MWKGLMPRIMRHMAHSTGVLLGRAAPGRGMTVFPDDVFLVSYMKSGNTWLRFLVGNLTHPSEPVTFANVETLVPSVYGLPDRVLRRIPRPRYLKSHEPFHAEYGRVIYIVRDPRDVAVSYYYHVVKARLLPRDCGIDEFVPQFLTDWPGFYHAPWPEHVIGWLAMRPSRRGFLLLRYEDLLQDTMRELHKVARFLQIGSSEDQLARAIELSTAENMRSSEKRDSKRWSTTRRTRSDVPFVRAARSGQWAQALSMESVAKIEAAWGPVMQALGYDLVNDPKELAPGSETWERWETQLRTVLARSQDGKGSVGSLLEL